MNKTGVKIHETWEKLVFRGQFNVCIRRVGNGDDFLVPTPTPTKPKHRI